MLISFVFICPSGFTTVCEDDGINTDRATHHGISFAEICITTIGYINKLL